MLRCSCGNYGKTEQNVRYAVWGDSMIKGTLVATWKMSYEGAEKGAELLKNSAPVHKSILAAIKTVEDNPEYVSVGYGGLPNINGEIELDAAYMDGDTLGFGGIISAKDIKNPIEAAYDLSRYQRNCLLAGAGAIEYAKEKGFAFQDMHTPKCRKRYEEADKHIDMELLEAYDGHDTVCVIGRDANASMACGVSTSGLFLKRAGRVGDSPIIGSGLYADSEIGCAAATGVGEDIMKGCLSYAIVARMEQGIDVQTACETAMQRHLDRLVRGGHKAGSMSVIAMDAHGNVGAATSDVEFPFVVADDEYRCHIYVASRKNGVHKVFEADEKWVAEYTGD